MACGAIAGLAAAWAGGCANQGAPPGGPVDRRPPVVVRTEPEAFAVVQDLNRPVRFHFDERISEQLAGGRLEDAVTVSPRTGDVRVGHGSRSITVAVSGGLRPGVVYRVTLLPGVRDLFGNQLVDPFELVFSTGGEATPTVLAGQIWDRATGQGVRDASVRAVGADSLVHVARADQQGIYAFRYLPPGTFTLTGFEDLDRDSEPGPREVKGSTSVTVQAGDTLLVDVPILPPDTTPAVLARASALDSLTIVLEHDDFLDPASDVGAVVVTLTRETGGAPGLSRLFHEHEYTAFARQAADSLAAADSTPAGGPPPSPPPPLPGARGAGGPSGSPSTGQAARAGQGAASAPAQPGRLLPARRLVARLDGPLAVGVEYDVTVAEVVNLNGLGGGGGEATLVLEPPPTPEDTTGAAPPGAADSLAVPQVAPPDTLLPGPRGGLR